jgi:class 3 adenylate cyclase
MDLDVATFDLPTAIDDEMLLMPERPGRRGTPKHPADRILTSKAAIEGERTQVTVLFVDVSGFTALSARLDPKMCTR